MAYEMKPDTGSIFKNDKREKDTQPNGKGQALIGGVEYWVSAWTNDGPRGKYQQLKFERKDAQKAAPTRPAPPVNDDDFGDPPF
jgi:hypothetical protein